MNLPPYKSIFLVRHGKPAALSPVLADKKIRAKELKQFMQNYDASGIDDSLEPNPLMHNKLSDVNSAYLSGLKRAQESFAYFNLQTPFIVDSLFNEIELPIYTKLPFKMKPLAWMSLFRALWFIELWFNKRQKSLIKERACASAFQLLESAEKSNKVALFGHGVMNYFIKKELLKRGAKLNNKWDHGYWACNEFLIQN